MEEINKRYNKSMDISYVETAAELFFKMLKEHPELCPHVYSWKETWVSDEKGRRTILFRCKYCGKEYKEERWE